MDSIQHVSSLITDIPSWLHILDEQNGQIGCRQAELARLAGSSLDQSFSSLRSLRNKGSTESLRPKADDILEEEEEAIVSDENEDLNIAGGLKKENSIHAASQPPLNSRQTASPRSPRLLQNTNFKKASPSNFTKVSSVPPTSHPPPTHLLKRRKSKSSSLHSIHSSVTRNSQTSSHPAKLNKSNRTRSMIMVYYDSAVQEAFENLVRYISAARNAMRKGKMAERLEKMRKLAELEDGSESSDQEEEEDGPLTPSRRNLDTTSKMPTADLGLTASQNANNLAGRGDMKAHKDKTNRELVVDTIEADDDEDDEDFLETAKLQFKSTRMMGPGRFAERNSGPRSSGVAASSPANQRAGNGRPIVAQTNSSPTLETGMGVSSRRDAEESSIYDDLDKSLEWCQSTCERAAHRFLRDGECYTEIAGVKKRLEELAARAEVEVMRAKETLKDENTKGEKRGSRGVVRIRGGGGVFEGGMIRAREMRSPLMRKSSTPIRTLSSPAVIGNFMDRVGKETKTNMGNNDPFADDLEVDEDEDEGVSDMDIDPQPKLIFRSARTGGVVKR